jgi:hypothetical protein
MVPRWAQRPPSLPSDCSTAWQLARRHVTAKFEAGDSVVNQMVQSAEINKQPVFGSCDVVTAVCCLFVSLSAHQWGWRRENGGSLWHHQPTAAGDVIARHGEGRGEDGPKEQSRSGCQTNLCHIAPPHNMSTARHGCAHMQLCGRQPFKTKPMVTHDLTRSRRMGALKTPLPIHGDFCERV